MLGPEGETLKGEQAYSFKILKGLSQSRGNSLT